MESVGVETENFRELLNENITEFEKNVDFFKKEYPSVLKAELDAMINAYQDNRRFKEDLRMYQRLFGRK